MGYGRIKEVLGGKSVRIIYYDDNKGDIEIPIAVTVRNPGIKAIKTLYASSIVIFL